MHDAYDLAVVLEKVAFEGASIEAGLDGFEREMSERASFWSKKCIENQSLWMRGSSVRDIVEQLQDFFGWE
jgi:hypothetical protein